MSWLQNFPRSPISAERRRRVCGELLILGKSVIRHTQAENFGTLERVAGAVDTAGDQRLTVRKHRGGVTPARGVEIAGKRPYAGRLRR